MLTFAAFRALSPLNDISTDGALVNYLTNGALCLLTLGEGAVWRGSTRSGFVEKA
jgi:hypothetical protein